MAKQAKKQKKELLDWLVPLICIVVVAGVLIGLLVGPVKNAIDYTRSRSIVLIESEDGSVSVKRPVVQVITWIQLYDSFRQTYSNYSMYKYYTNIFGDSIDLSSLISSDEVSWAETNIYYMQTQMGLTLYTYSDVDDENVTNEDVTTSAGLFALYMAANVENYLGSYLDSYLESIKHYVAVAGAAKAAGVTLDADDLADVEETMDSFKALPETLSYKKSLAKFIKTFIGASVKESDVHEAYELMILASKYSKIVSDQYYDGITDAERIAYRDENKGDFYTAEYIGYSTEDKAVADKLKVTETADAFKQIVAKAILDKAYAVKIAELEKEILTESVTTAEDLNLDGTGFGALTTYAKGAEGLDAALAEAFFNGEAKDRLTVYLYEGEDGAYLVWFEEASSESATVRTKFFAYDGFDSYDGISSFRADVYGAVLASVGEGSIRYPVDHDSSAFHSVAEKCFSVTKESTPGTSTASFTDNAKTGSFEAWISDLSLAAGKTTVIEKTENEKTTYSVYLLVSPMALDENASVNGGYLKFTDETAANDGKKAIEGKTGTFLVEALQNLNSESAVANSKFASSDFNNDTLRDWFFSADRKSGDIAILSAEEEVVNEESEEEGTKTETVYYLVAFRSAMSAWESKATEGAADEKTNDWVEAEEENLTVNEKELTRLGVDLTHNHDEDAE